MDFVKCLAYKTLMTRRFLTHFSTVFFLHVALVFGGIVFIANEAATHKLGNSILNIKIAGAMIMGGSPQVSAPRPVRSTTAKSSKVKTESTVAPVTASDSSTSSSDAVGGKPGSIPGYAGGTLSGTALADLKTIYKAELRAQIVQNKFYPLAARRLGQTGIVVVAFTLLADGSIQNIRIEDSSGNDRLDTAGLEAVKKVGKFKEIPSEFASNSIDMSVPIKFQTL